MKPFLNSPTQDQSLAEAARLCKRAERGMKISFALTCAALGLLIGNFYILRPALGRYVVQNVGPAEAPHPLRLDTATGRTWLFQGEWVLIKDAK
jgi:hypothetical protein